LSNLNDTRGAEKGKEVGRSANQTRGKKTGDPGQKSSYGVNRTGRGKLSSVARGEPRKPRSRAARTTELRRRGKGSPATVTGEENCSDLLEKYRRKDLDRTKTSEKAGGTLRQVWGKRSKGVSKSGTETHPEVARSY